MSRRRPSMNRLFLSNPTREPGTMAGDPEASRPRPPTRKRRRAQRHSRRRSKPAPINVLRSMFRSFFSSSRSPPNYHFFGPLSKARIKGRAKPLKAGGHYDILEKNQEETGAMTNKIDYSLPNKPTTRPPWPWRGEAEGHGFQCPARKGRVHRRGTRPRSGWWTGSILSVGPRNLAPGHGPAAEVWEKIVHPPPLPHRRRGGPARGDLITYKQVRTARPIYDVFQRRTSGISCRSSAAFRRAHGRRREAGGLAGPGPRRLRGLPDRRPCSGAVNLFVLLRTRTMNSGRDQGPVRRLDRPPPSAETSRFSAR